VRCPSLWRRMLGIEGKAVVERVVFEEAAEQIVVWVRPFRSEPRRCGRCGRVAPGYDRGEGRRRWRALDAGTLRVFVEADAPRVNCPTHGPTVVAVPWARHDARHTHDFDATVAWLVLHAAKSTVAAAARVAWETVGSIVERVMADQDAVAADRLANVRRIGIDEVSYQRGHKYLVVVVNHATGQLLWVGEGRERATLAAFFDLLGEPRCARIVLVSADGADWIADMVALCCPNARLCMDPFHVVQWANEALDQVRRRVWPAAPATGRSPGS
jgi:transposase